MARIPIKSKTIVKNIQEKQGKDIVILDVKGLSITDYFVVVTADSTVQAGSIADFLLEKMELRGHKALGIEGMPYNHWILIDFEDVVVHVFLPELRELYDIEDLWYDSQKFYVDDNGDFT